LTYARNEFKRTPVPILKSNDVPLNIERGSEAIIWRLWYNKYHISILFDYYNRNHQKLLFRTFKAFEMYPARIIGADIFIIGILYRLRDKYDITFLSMSFKGLA
jgi:hypothetical protein